MRKEAEAMYEIESIDERAADEARKRWLSLAKPLHGLGKLEEQITAIAGMKGKARFTLDKRAVLVMCADNGVVEEGVTQTTSDVTAVVTENFAKGETSVCKIAKTVNAEVFAVDVGVAADVSGVLNRKIAYGTKNFAKEKAMTRSEAIKAVEIGIDCVRELKNKGYDIIVTGEMGIGNTTTSAAVTSALLDIDAELITGRGAGLSDEGLKRKIGVIKKALELHRPDRNDVIDVLSKVGGFDIAALAGAFIGGAMYRVPMVIDGMISAAAALCAQRLALRAADFMIASHSSKESAEALILKELNKEAVIYADMHLGEGTGGAIMLPVLDAALAVYNNMPTFADIKIDEYKELT